MRLSSTQKDILFLLFAIEQKGSKEPVPGMTILKMINNSRSSELFDTNFRVSCHKLHKHMMVKKYRYSNLKLAWCLSEDGRARAIEIYNSRLVN